MRRMRAAGNVIEKNGLSGAAALSCVHILDGLVRHVRGEVVARIAYPWKNLGVIA